ncbi:MAG: entericidin A/B family lipoprotein [Pseudomonadota bacterium]|nr:entericidin A/B family lipoprotein [Pseudomonadota bacterium]
MSLDSWSDLKLDELKTLFLTVLFVSSTAVIVGCNTARGIGQDVEATGDAIENAAEGAKENM